MHLAIFPLTKSKSFLSWFPQLTPHFWLPTLHPVLCLAYKLFHEPISSSLLQDQKALNINMQRSLMYKS